MKIQMRIIDGIKEIKTITLMNVIMNKMQDLEPFRERVEEWIN